MTIAGPHETTHSYAYLAYKYKYAPAYLWVVSSFESYNSLKTLES